MCAVAKTDKFIGEIFAGDGRFFQVHAGLAGRIVNPIARAEAAAGPGRRAPP
jgi:hypothetical protein